jgi:hypothetical protein
MSLFPHPSKFGPPDRSTRDDQSTANTEAYPHNKIAPALVLEALSDVIVFQRIFVTMTGSVTAALMLSHAIELSSRTDQESAGWFELSQEQWLEQTGLSRFEQSTARKVLRENGFLQEERRGVPSRLMYWVNSDRVWTVANQLSQNKHPHLWSTRTF